METKEILSYRDLIVWRKAMDLTISVYRLTKKYPAEELYDLTSQTKRSVKSIPANIAEGRMRGSKKKFHHFLSIAYASGAELETHLEIAKRLPFGKDLGFTEVDSLLLEVMKMLNKMLQNRFTSS
jgi:four helix bundle protein